MKNYVIIPVLMLVVLLSGCKDDKTGTTELEGTWSIGCTSDGFDNYSKETLTYSGNSISMKIENFDDASCSEKGKQTEFSVTGNFSLGDELTLSSGRAARNIDLSNLKWFITIYNGTVIPAFNSKQLCGKANWQKGQKTEITNCDAFGGALGQSESYDIYRISGTSLFQGDTEYGDTRSKNNRPTQLLEGSFYTKAN